MSDYEAAAEDGRPEHGRGRLSTRTRWISGLVTAVVVAAGGAVATGLVNGLFIDEPAPVLPGGGFTAGVSAVYACGQTYALAGGLDPDTGAGPLYELANASRPQMAQVLREQGGAAQTSVTVELILTGTSTRPTRILGVDVARLRTAPTLDGTLLRTPCDGTESVIPVSVDLDTAPRAMMSGSRPYFDGRNLDVSIDDRETLRVNMTAKQHSYSWIFAIRYIDSSGATATSYLDADGRIHTDPDNVLRDAEFTLTGPANRYAYVYRQSGSKFYPERE
ncbi:hypothetical protein [Catellatospora paridis]|uniref:hypothetical protein n=1 Tax=Catellatospora paridis TaxID=1617086 RepID=UPI0012D3E8ED|nr:hypothetical protein [Catellatospora paridis]